MNRAGGSSYKGTKERIWLNKQAQETTSPKMYLSTSCGKCLSNESESIYCADCLLRGRKVVQAKNGTFLEGKQGRKQRWMCHVCGSRRKPVAK